MSTPFYKRRPIQIAAVLIAIPVLAVAWWLGSPLFIDDVVDEAFPLAAGAEIPDDMTMEEVEAEMEEAAAEESTVEETIPAGDDSASATSEPVALATGRVAGADDRHQGSGTATVYELEDGSRVLRLEDLDVTNGPQLHVILTPVTDVQGRDDVTAAGYLDLGGLKGNIGSQNYEIPADYEIPDEFSVVIYCVPFHVIFATAALS